MVGFADSWHPKPPPGNVSAWTELRVKQATAIVECLGIDSVDVVGSSMGALVAQHLMWTQPLRVRRAVLLAPAGAPVDMTDELQKVIDFYEDPTRECLLELFRSFVHDPVGGLDSRFEGMVDRVLSVALRPDVARSFSTNFVNWHKAGLEKDQLASIHTPTLIIHGQEDRIIPVKAASLLSYAISGSSVKVLPNCGHWIPVQQGEEMLRLIRAFLD